MADELASYFADIGKNNIIPHTEMMSLFREMNASEDVARKTLLRHRLAVSNFRLVLVEARRHSNCGASISDLVQEGNIGLFRAIEKFDPDRGFHFSTYARWWIKQAIMRYINNKLYVIKIPHEIVKSISSAKEQYSKICSVDVTEDNIDVIDDNSQIVNSFVGGIFSFDVIEGSNCRGKLNRALHASLQDSVGIGTLNPYTAIEFKEITCAVKRALKKLSKREEMVLRLRFGISENPTDSKNWPITSAKLAELERRSK